MSLPNTHAPLSKKNIWPNTNTPTHHDVKLAEERELDERARRLAVRLARVAQVLDGPDDGEEDGAADDDVHQVQNILPAAEQGSVDVREGGWGKRMAQQVMMSARCRIFCHVPSRSAWAETPKHFQCDPAQN